MFWSLVAPSLVVAAWVIGAGLSVIRAAAAAVGRFPLLVVLVYVADEGPVAHASMGRRRSQERRNNRVIGGCPSYTSVMADEDSCSQRRWTTSKKPGSASGRPRASCALK